MCAYEHYAHVHLCMQAYDFVSFFNWKSALFVFGLLFFLFSVLPPLCLNKQLARTLMRAQWRHGPGSLCGRSWRLWECKGHLVNEYEGPSYYNFVNDK